MECDCGDAFEGDNCESETCKDKKTELVLHKRSVVELFKGGCERLIHDEFLNLILKCWYLEDRVVYFT